MHLMPQQADFVGQIVACSLAKAYVLLMHRAYYVLMQNLSSWKIIRRATPLLAGIAMV